MISFIRGLDKMEKRRILVAGKNEQIIDDLYRVQGEGFEIMCTSPRYDDILTHIKYFKPELFLYCPDDTAEKFAAGIADSYVELLKLNIPLVVCAAEAVCEQLKNDTSVKFSQEIKWDKETTQWRALAEVFKQLDEDRVRIENVKKEISGVAADAPKKHILVIDDDPMMLKLVKEYLHDEYQVATAINGRTAYKFLENKTTDLILLDYEMPGENGSAVLRNLRDNEKTASIPVLFLTGITDRDKIQEILSLKPQGYILKPIDHDKLVNTIVKFI